MIDVKKLTIKNCAITVINDIIVTFIAYAIYTNMCISVTEGALDLVLIIVLCSHIAFVYPC